MKRILISLLAAGAMATPLTAMPISYTITVDSSSVSSSTPGFIEFQFNQANASTSLAATASVSEFTSTGFAFDNTSNASLGGVTGSLQSLPLVFDNTVGGSNLYDQGVSQFGSGFSFILTLDGAALASTATDGSQFFVFLLGTNYSTLVGPDIGVAGVTVNGDSTVTTNAAAGLSTVDPYTAPADVPADAPEPATFALLGIGASGLVVRGLRFSGRNLPKTRIP